MSEKWVRDNLMIDSLEDAIDWGNGIYTPVSVFLTMFGEVIEGALANGADVRKAIVDNDNGRGYASLISI